MAGLGSTLARLAALRISPDVDIGGDVAKRLEPLVGFGTNPGALRGWSYVPRRLARNAPLVVILHGCTQNAAGYDLGSGWSQMAEECGIALLFPEQQRANNPNLCFNWFSSADSLRDAGEPLSIRQMIASMVATHDLDANRIFITGLSAGGAMTSIMLAAYPELFAGGAIIAGLPFGAAASIGEAFSRMAGQGYPSDTQLAALVRNASSHDGPWPVVSVWHGSADGTVHPSNATRIVEQWRLVHGLRPEAFAQERIAGHAHRSWRNDAEKIVLEEFIIAGMGHGTPLSTLGKDGCGKAGPYMLEVGISSTRQIAHLWGLGGTVEKADSENAIKPGIRLSTRSKADSRGRAPTASARHPSASPPPRGVGAIIEDALRKAGLMR